MYSEMNHLLVQIIGDVVLNVLFTGPSILAYYYTLLHNCTSTHILKIFLAGQYC